MFFYEGQSCPVCGKHFAETDDIVSCPQCGAPHHRECWRSEGQCHFAADHGTERQWPAGQTKKPEPQEPYRQCPNCGKQNPEFAEFCAHCGRDLGASEWHSAAPKPPVNQYTPPFQTNFTPPPLHDPLGGIPRGETIEGVAVETLAEVIGPNSAYYLPRFYHISRSGKKRSWNLAAFLFTAKWLLYRKNLLIGWLIFAFECVLSFFSLYADMQLTDIGYAALVTSQNGRVLYAMMVVSSFAGLAVSIVLGLFGNWLYMQQVLKKARKLQEDPDLQYNQNFLNTGGVSPAMGALPFLILLFVQYLMAFIL